MYSLKIFFSNSHELRFRTFKDTRSENTPSNKSARALTKIIKMDIGVIGTLYQLFI